MSIQPRLSGTGSNTSGNPVGIWPDQNTNYPNPLTQTPGRILPTAPGISEDVTPLIYPGYTPNPAAAAVQFNTSWGSNRDNSASTGKMWKNDKTDGANRADFLGTGQWGVESGGTPWGHTTASEASPSEQLTDTSRGIPAAGFGVKTDVGRTMAEYVLGTVDTVTPGLPTSSVEGDGASGLNISTNKIEATNQVAQKTNSVSSFSSGDAPNTTASSTNISPTNSQSDSTPSDKPPDNDENTATEKTEANIGDGQGETSATTASPTTDQKPSSDAQQAPAPSAEAEVSQGQFVAAASPGGSGVDATVQQMQQLSLDPYPLAMQQQMAIAMQQQYNMLAATQQPLAMPGVFLPNFNPYIIAGPTNPAAAGYGDAAAAAQYTQMMAQYASWPGYPSPMLQPVATATPNMSQAPSTPTTTQAQSSTAQPPRSPFLSEDGATPDTPQMQPNENIEPNLPQLQAQLGFNPMAMGAAGYQMIPTAYYDQTGAFIVNNGRGGPLGGPVRLFAPAPFVMNGSGVPSSMYASPNLTTGNTTPIAQGQTLYNPNFQFGINNGATGMGNNFGSRVGSSNSTPHRRDSFSDPYSKQPYPSPMSNFYTNMNIGAMSSSPGPFGGLMGAPPPSHHSMSPPLSSPTNSLIGTDQRQFPVAPGAEARYRNGNFLNAQVFGNSGSALFPPTRISRSMSGSGRSRLLDDFRNNRYPNPQLRDLVNHIVEFSRDQHGSRFIQQKLERATPAEKQLVFSEIRSAAYQLMTDVFGNYVIQKFFEFGSPEQKLQLAQCIQGNVLALALQMYGCRVIQKALECIPTEEQVNIVKELDGHLLECVKDQNGNHVVQKCIECVLPVHLQFIVESFKGQVATLSRHPYGCRVMQRILEHCTTEQTTPILDELNQYIEALVVDQYGNYVIQHILEHGRPETKRNIVLELRGKVLALSQHKFASNVVEKCVSNSSHSERVILIEEVCQNDDSLYFMMKDQFANYVVQKMLDVAEPPQRNLLIQRIRPHIQHLRKFTYGKHIINKLEKYMISKPGSVPTSPLGTPTSPLSNLTQPPLTQAEAPPVNPTGPLLDMS